MSRPKGSKNKPKTFEELEKEIEPETIKAEKRTLYECYNAKVKGKDIHCAKGYHLSRSASGNIDIIRLARGEPLAITICQDCPDVDSKDDPVPANEKGWIKKVV